MRHLEIHRRLAVRFVRYPTDHLGREPRQARRIGERVEVALVEAIECEEHDGLALTGMAFLRQRGGVVRVQQPTWRQAALRHIEGKVVGPFRAMWRVAHDPAEPGDHIVQRRRHRWLLRRRVEHLASSAPVVVHRHLECARHVAGGTFDDRPGVSRTPSHPQLPCARPCHQGIRTRRVGERHGQLRITGARRPEICRAGEQRCERTLDNRRIGRRAAGTQPRRDDDRRRPDERRQTPPHFGDASRNRW